MIISIFRLPKLQIRILLEKITNHNHSNMKIHLQRFILLFFLIPFVVQAQTVNPIVEKNKT
jgi:hypothetical protein